VTSAFSGCRKTLHLNAGFGEVLSVDLTADVIECYLRRRLVQRVQITRSEGKVAKRHRQAEHGLPRDFLEIFGATRRDRTGDLLITKLPVYSYAIHSTVGQTPHILARSACWALIEPDSEPNYSAAFSPTSNQTGPAPAARSLAEWGFLDRNGESRGQSRRLGHSPSV
jgi:hypothetical protein